MNPTPAVKTSFKQQMLKAREEAIVQTVNRLLAEKGFEAMTVDEVAAQVGIAVADGVVTLTGETPRKDGHGVNGFTLDALSIQTKGQLSASLPAKGGRGMASTGYTTWRINCPARSN